MVKQDCDKRYEQEDCPCLTHALREKKKWPNYDLLCAIEKEVCLCITFLPLEFPLRGNGVTLPWGQLLYIHI